jgi:CheY-like chemotaxis protein
MVVEDDVLIRSVFAEDLRDNGISVIEAASADEAWRILTTGIVIDLIFSDIVMPGSMDGNDLARRVNAMAPQIKILLTSGNTMASPGVKIERFLQKPYQPYLAIEIILKILGLDGS